ncbi:MAG: Rab family GTPase [Candidatus Thorarchaeota archaeon]
MPSNVVKIVFVGAGGAGKSATAYRLANGAFRETMMTIGLDIDTWSLSDEDTGGHVKIAAFDLGGQEQFRFFQDRFVAGAECVLILVDMTRWISLDEVDEWIDLIRHIPKDRWLLIANKADAATTMSEEDIKEKAEELGISYIVVSAKTGDNFDNLSKMISDLVFNDVEN